MKRILQVLALLTLSSSCFAEGLAYVRVHKDLLQEHLKQAQTGDAERIAVNVASLYREFGAKDTPSDAATLFGWMAQLWKDRK